MTAAVKIGAAIDNKQPPTTVAMATCRPLHFTLDSEWFVVSTVDASSTPSSTNLSRNITGNFVWIRANVENFSAGTITKVAMSY
jgi:hypothetical protein